MTQPRIYHEGKYYDSLEWREVPLTQGQYAYVDPVDYEWVIEFNWYFRSGYAARAVGRHGEQNFILMQNEIMGVERGTDHINRDKLDNRRSNLRVVDDSHNNFNRVFSKERELPRGVHASNNGRVKNRWQALITVQREQINLGTFSSIAAASDAYKAASIHYRGELPPEYRNE